ncbi:MAG: patatin-like phospholipase family protein [Pseudorhodoplanes sp.]|nr:patatin-like phospholipase family protein [Pseudorhodoplanes sp.]
MVALRPVASSIVLAFCALSLAACATVQRIPYTAEEKSDAIIPGFADARVWADDPNISARYAGINTRQPVMLALSGGGADGAFGAGFLAGWSERGARPQFHIVTGASAGALIAPFAFLGPGYDEVLRRVFASGEMENFLQFEGVSGLFGTGLFKAGPLRALIAKYIDASTLEAIAIEYRAGRRLFIVTTDLDSQRTAIWDMGKIASSGSPQALDLFRRVMEASTSIPGIFSPVLIDVEANGKKFAEMHVDGGVTANILVVPEAILLAKKPILPANVKPKIYAILNGKLGPYFEVVKPNTFQIAVRAFATSVRSNTRNTLLASYEFVKRRGWELNLAAIDDSVPNQEKPGFDTTYMKGLFEYGYERGRSGQMWQRSPNEPVEQERARGPRVASQ